MIPQHTKVAMFIIDLIYNSCIWEKYKPKVKDANNILSFQGLMTTNKLLYL